jgi:PP-loop superfamily ATP-utilizing enzyme
LDNHTVGKDGGMDAKKRYVSYGGGVNSTAMIIYMVEEGIAFDEVVFADTGAEWPETYQYLDFFTHEYLSRHSLSITRITSKEMGVRRESLLEHYRRLSVIPCRVRRHCTQDWKIKPMFRYYEKPCVQFLGIDAGEAHRAKPSRQPDVENDFPLIDAGINRQECKRIIKNAGLCLPRKSGCYFCPFSRISQLRELHQLHPELFEIIVNLEKAHEEKFNKGKEVKFYIKDKPMWELRNRFVLERHAEEMQLELFDDPQDSMNCLCKFG